MRALFVRGAVLAVALVLAAALVDGVDIDGGPLVALGIAAVFALVNAVLGPILRLLARPITVVTLGLFALVVNGVLLVVTAWIVDRLEVDGFLAAVGAALVVSLASTVLGLLVRPATRDR